MEINKVNKARCYKVSRFFVLGRDLVELAKRAKYNPPAMRVETKCYTKKSPFRYNRVVQALLQKGKVIYGE